MRTHQFLLLLTVPAWFLCLAGCFASEPSAAADVLLVDDGQPKATIVIAKDADAKVKLAAEELQRYVEKISGARLPIVPDNEHAAGTLVLVGRSQYTGKMPVAPAVEIPAGLTPSRREEGFVIVARGDRLLLAGNDEGPYHGTEYAVYDFLRSMGVRWFMPSDDGEIVPRQKTIRVGECSIRRKPDFVMRNWWLHAVGEMPGQESRWKLRNKMNPDEMFAIPGDSSVHGVCAPAALLKEKPELFALNENGTRNPQLPNLTNPDAIRHAADVIRKHYRNKPQSNSFGFAPDDGMPRDFNPATMKLNQGFVELAGRPGVPGEVSTSEEWFTFASRVAAEVRKDFPETYLATNGYANRDLPPQGIKLDDHLVVMFAAIWSCTLHGYDDPHCWQKGRQGQMLRRWCELCKNVWVYGYNEQMLVSGLTPLPEFTKLRRDFPLMKKWGVMGFWDESRNVWAEPGIASRYLRAQLEWDADADVDAILDDFFAKWYGRAAAPMKAFYMALDRAVSATPMHGHEDRILPELYTPQLMAELKRHLAAAVPLADNPRDRQHVRADELIYDHLAAYVDMSAADMAGDFAAAAQHADRMLALRKDLYAINPFYIWKDEKGYHSGVGYWTITDRRKFYQSLADKLSGKSGELVTMLPQEASLRIDPHEDGVFAKWYAPDVPGTVPARRSGTPVPDDANSTELVRRGVPDLRLSPSEGWRTVTTRRPFYRQGFDDPQGHPYVGHVWYRFKLSVPESARGKKVMLYVPVLVTEAWCWINGNYVGHRGYQEAYVRPAAMEVDVTDALRPGATNVIAFCVDTSNAPAQAAEGIYSRGFLYAVK